MPDFSKRDPKECPSPEYHQTHNYCPNCSFVFEADSKTPDEVAARAADDAALAAEKRLQ